MERRTEGGSGAQPAGERGTAAAPEGSAGAERPPHSSAGSSAVAGGCHGAVATGTGFQRSRPPRAAGRPEPRGWAGDGAERSRPSVPRVPPAACRGPTPVPEHHGSPHPIATTPYRNTPVPITRPLASGDGAASAPLLARFFPFSRNSPTAAAPSPPHHPKTPGAPLPRVMRAAEGSCRGKPSISLYAWHRGGGQVTPIPKAAGSFPAKGLRRGEEQLFSRLGLGKPGRGCAGPRAAGEGGSDTRTLGQGMRQEQPLKVGGGKRKKPQTAVRTGQLQDTQ